MKEIIYDWCGLNITLFQLIHSHHSPAYDLLMQGISASGKHYWFFVYSLILWFYATRQTNSKWHSSLITLVLSYPVMVVVVGAVKHFIALPRPFALLPADQMHLIAAVIQAENPFVSFPSGHAAFAMLMLASLWPAMGRIGKGLMLLWVLLVGWSRMSLGLHFPADIAGGFAVSWLIVWLVNRFVTPFVITRPFIRALLGCYGKPV